MRQPKPKFCLDLLLRSRRKGPAQFLAHDRLARAKRVKLSDIASEPMVWIRRAAAPSTYDIIMRACLQAGVSPSIVQEATSEPMALSLVSVGGL